jgi:hypothetical protein
MADSARDQYVEALERINRATDREIDEAMAEVLRKQARRPRGITPGIRKKLSDAVACIPEFDRGLSWRRRNSWGVEELTVYGETAASLKFIIDHVKDLRVILAEEPAPVFASRYDDQLGESVPVPIDPEKVRQLREKMAAPRDWDAFERPSSRTAKGRG